MYVDDNLTGMYARGQALQYMSRKIFCSIIRLLRKLLFLFDMRKNLTPLFQAKLQAPMQRPLLESLESGEVSRGMYVLVLIG